ncbi:nitrate ABC transporter, permease protein [Phormidesmis priestleyi ULC007]|uniref:Nitrate ABC transporter, permease protein n=1 Tax=Phormidesmis priestleyi ULC007 TaxID=1920490 RepID=A0A2T1DIH1_9CYAN|nr:nitrate ABC transporter permease [Phormidesmis priestleyi]PSB20309.1 nitrate ABC transporter, permease protein [Phormidesmis priestleyi ULC007]PZO50178.1 MAG: nitrate ABC transporter, permease protein [Phormidesmis priestleyi]
MTVTPSLRSDSSSALLETLQKFAKQLIPPIVCTAVVLVIWQLLCLSPETKMPGPITVLKQTYELILNPFYDDGGTSKGLGLQIWISLQRVMVGYSLAAIVGISLGVLIGMSQFMRRGLDPMIQVLRTVPPLAWLPLSLGIFQDSTPAALFVIFITAIWPIVINTALGVQQIPQDYNNVAKVLRLSGKEYFFNILVPSTVPYVFGGLRIGIGLAWLAIVAAEMLKAEGGIGFFIWDAYNAGNENSMSQIIIAVLYVGLVGLALDRLVNYLGSLIVSEN